METLEIEGKSYVAAKAAAREHHYTSDYLGQLIRGGKLVGKKVGRAWYVEVDSLDHFIQSVANPASETNIHEEKPVVLMPLPVAEEQVVAAQEVVQNVPVSVTIMRKPIEVSPAVRHELNEAFPLRYLTDDEPSMPVLKNSRDTFINKSISTTQGDGKEFNVPIHRGQESTRTHVSARIEEDEVVVPQRDVQATQLKPVLMEFQESGRGFLGTALVVVLFAALIGGAAVSGIATSTITYGAAEKNAAGIGFAIPFSF